MADNQFSSTVEALFKGMDSFVATKTVVGEAVKIDDAIILPLVDVSCGMAAGAFNQPSKNNGAGGMSASAVLIIQNGVTKLVNVKHQDAVTKIIDMVPDFVNRFAGGISHTPSQEAVKKAEDMAETFDERTDAEATATEQKPRD